MARIGFAIVAGLAIVLGACGEARSPTHEAALVIDPARYGELVKKFDEAMQDCGLARYGAAPGLDELRGRKVLYFEYRQHKSDNWAFVTATDLLNAGTVDIRVYETALLDVQRRKDAMARLAELLADFGVALSSRP